jgi:acetolactate synthase small subunit
MHAFHIRYRNTQGTLMRILNAASRRGLDMLYVKAEPADGVHQLTVVLEVTPKQSGQLWRDWHAVVDVIDVRAALPLKDTGMRDLSWASSETPRAAVDRAVSRAESASA